MKRTVLLALVFLIGFSAFACGESDRSEPPLVIIVNGDELAPYLHLAWVESWENGEALPTDLPEGEYYLVISVKARGDFIEEADRYESSGYDCVYSFEIN